MKNKRLPATVKKDVPSLPDPVQLYFREISKYPVLTKEQEIELSKKFFETKDPELAKALARANLRFVVKIAAEYTRFGSRLIDLIQEGNIGLLHAIKEFNPYKGVRLITYAVWWIKGYIQEYLMRQHSLVRIGTNAKQRKLFYLLRKEKEQLAYLPYEQNHPKLIAPAGFKDKDVQSMRQRLQTRDISLNYPVSSQEKNTMLLNLQVDSSESSQEEQLISLQEKEIIKKSVQSLRPHLNKKELFILNNRLLSDTPLTLREIGEKFSVTREAIRQMESRLMKKIKDAVTTYIKDNK